MLEENMETAKKRREAKAMKDKDIRKELRELPDQKTAVVQ